MGRHRLGCEASGRKRVRRGDTSRPGKEAGEVIPPHRVGGMSFALPRRRGVLGVSSTPDTHSLPLLDESQNSCRGAPAIRAGEDARALIGGRGKSALVAVAGPLPKNMAAPATGQ